MAHFNRGFFSGGQKLVLTDLEVDSTTLVVDATNNRIGIGTAAPGTTLQLSSTTTALTLQNSTSENTDGGCESKIIFEDHADTALAQIEGSHSGSSDDTKGKLILSTHSGSAITAAVTISESQEATFAATAFFNKSISFDSSPADTVVSGVTAAFTAGEALSLGEVVYFKASDSKMWKAVATAAATSRCVAMAAEDISADAIGAFLLQGFIRADTNFPTWTVGGAIYTPEAEVGSPGQNVPEQAQPDTDGDFVQVLGWAIDGNTVYFNPSNDIIEVA